MNVENIRVKIKRLSIRWPVALKFLLASSIVFFYRKELSQISGKYICRHSAFFAFKAVLKELLKSGDIGKSRIRYCSLPLCSDFNTPYTYTADSYLVHEKQWVNLFHCQRGINNPKAFSYAGSLICLYAELLLKRGFFTHGYAIYLWLIDHNKISNQIMGSVGLLDVKVLFNKWNNQLTHYEKGGSWFNADKIAFFSDELSFFFKSSSDADVDKQFLDLQKLDSTLLISKFIFADYLTSRFKIHEAYLLYQKISETFSGNTLITQKLHQYEEFINNSNRGEYSVLEIPDIAANDIIKLDSDNQSVVTKKLSHSFYLGSDLFFEEFTLSFSHKAVRVIENAFDVGSLIGFNKNGKKYFLKESHPLNIDAFKMFNRFTCINDRNKAVILNRTEVDSGKAYFIPGNGWSYYHWLIETIPYLLKYKEQFLHEMPLYFTYPLQRWHLEIITLLGLEDVEILPLLKGQRRVFKTLYIQDVESNELITNPSEILDVRKILAKPKEVKLGKRYYFTRKSNQGIRKVEKVNIIEKLLSQHGFISIDPSDYSISEQIELFSDVEAIVGEGGAAFSNLIFCPSETIALCLTSERCFYTSFTAIASAIGQDISYSVSNSRVIPSPYFMWCARSFQPCIEIIEKWLKDKRLF